MDPVIGYTLRFCFALLFGTAALHKIRDPRAFRETLAQYDLVAAELVGPAGVALLAAEIAVAVTLPWIPSVALGASWLLAMYAAAIAVNLWRGRRDIDCGCMGPGAHVPISGYLVARNLVLSVVAMAAATPPSGRELVWVDALTIACASAALVALWLATERLLVLGPALARTRSESR